MNAKMKKNQTDELFKGVNVLNKMFDSFSCLIKSFLNLSKSMDEYHKSFLKGSYSRAVGIITTFTVL